MDLTTSARRRGHLLTALAASLWLAFGGIAVRDDLGTAGNGGSGASFGGAAGAPAPDGGSVGGAGTAGTSSGAGAESEPTYDCDHPPPYGHTECCGGELCRGYCTGGKCHCLTVEGGCFPGSACCPGSDFGCKAEEKCPNGG